MGDSTPYSIQATIPERYQLSGLRRPMGIKVPIPRMPLAYLCGRKIASVTTSTAVGHLQSPTCYLSPQIPVRMANHRCLPMDPRRLCSTSGQTGWNHIRGARVHTPVAGAIETPSHRLSLAGAATSLPTHLTYYRGTSLHLNGSGDPGIWDRQSWTRVLRETGRLVGEKDILPHPQLLLRTLRRSFMVIPGGGVEMTHQDDDRLCPTGDHHLGISYLRLSLRYHLPPRFSLRSSRRKRGYLRRTRRPFLSGPYRHQSIL